MDRKNIIEILKNGGVAVLPTDTLYGLCASVFSREAVEKIYTLKKRDPKKALIVLISSLEDLKIFGVDIKKYEGELEKFWPGKVSVILPCNKEEFTYIHRGQNNIAFRVPDKEDLLELLKESGPLVAPSANPEGAVPAKNVEEAKRYFGDSADLYLDGGELNSLPSTIIHFDGSGNIITQRIGAG